jgi:hypothetical protein
MYVTHREDASQGAQAPDEPSWAEGKQRASPG